MTDMYTAAADEGSMANDAKETVAIDAKGSVAIDAKGEGGVVQHRKLRYIQNTNI